MKLRTAVAKLVPVVTVLVLVSGFSAGLPSAAESDKIYIVRPGDTLSGIAGRLLGNVDRWREILEANPQITAPDMIYPGDSLTLPLPEPAVPEEELAVREEVAPPPPPPPSPAAAADALRDETTEEPALPVEKVRQIPVISHALYRTAGYISKELPEAAIVASIEDRESMGEGDSVVINLSADEGTRYTVVRPAQPVFHPKTGTFLGWMIRILGTAEVICPGPRCSTAVLGNTYDYVAVGDLLVPFDPDDFLEENVLGPKTTEMCLYPKEEDATVVAAQEDIAVPGEGNIVFLDKGSADGVGPGNQFAVYRKVAAESYAFIGQLQVLRTEERTSTALITNSLQELQVEDQAQAI
jgi:hypothetical protein